MKKLIFPIYCRISLALACAFPCLAVIVKLLEMQNICFYFLRCGVEEIIPVCTVFTVAFLISAVAVFFCKNTKRTPLVVWLSTALSVFIFPSLVFFSFLFANGTYHEHTSPDGAHDIVVNEKAMLFAGGGDIYEKTSFCTMKKVGHYTTDDGYLPFTNDTFSFTFCEDNFELNYCYGDLEESYKTITMEYAK